MSVAAGVLLVAGLPKLRRPDAAAAALAAVGLPGGVAAVRLLACVEVAVGLVCLLDPVRAACLAMAVLYLALAAFVLAAARLPEPPASCGCIGGADEPPPHALHAGIDVLLAGAALIGVVAGASSLPDLVGASPATAVPLLLGLAACVALVVAALETLPAVLLSYRAEAAGGEA